MKVFDQNNKLECSKSDPKFIFLVVSLRQLLSDCTALIKDNDVEGAKTIISQTVESYLPEEPSNLDKLPESNIFLGEYAENFSKVYFNLIELWKDIQNDRISFLTGDEYKTDSDKLLAFLGSQKENLEKILNF